MQLVAVNPVFASQEAETLLAEFDQLREHVLSQEADGVVGGYMNYIQKDGYKILFKPEFDTDHDVIRIFMNREFPEKDFAITYILSDHLYDGRRVLRRFIGPEPTGWRNHSVDVVTLEYLGSQGNSALQLKEEEAEILRTLGISLL